ncbi:MAG: hypothetical protein ACTIDE_03480 [Carnobacterium maltaromaticum]
MSDYSGVEIYLTNIEKNLNQIRELNKGQLSHISKKFFNDYEEKLEEFKKKFSSFEEELGEIDGYVTQLISYVEVEGS